MKNILLYLLDSERFRVSLEAKFTHGVEETYKITEGLRKIPDDDIPKASQGFAGRALQQFAYSQNRSTPLLYVYFQQHVKDLPIDAISVYSQQG